MKKVYFTLFIMVFSFSYCYGAGSIVRFNAYPNLSGSSISDTDEWILWDTSAGATKNVLNSELINMLNSELNLETHVSYVNLTTGGMTLTDAQSGNSFTNTSATANVTFTLPECTVTTLGWKGVFRVISTSYEFYVDSHANDILYPIVNNYGDKIEGQQTLGSAVYVECVNISAGVYDWLVNDDGTWVDAN
jgi:hypothetical protein